MGEALRKMSTIEDLNNLDLPEGQRAELIDGELYLVDVPTRKHQEIVGGVFNAIYNHIAEHNGSCKVYVSPLGVRLFADDSTYVEPDICVICDQDKLNDEGCNGAPELVVEVTSPSTRSRDCLLKFMTYKAAGVKEYWLIDPERDILDVYYFETEQTERFTFHDKVPSTVCDGLVVDFAKMNLD